MMLFSDRGEAIERFATRSEESHRCTMARWDSS